MVRFQAKVFTQRAEARLTKAIKKITKQADISANDMKNLGKETARVLVPKGRTGWLYKSIQGKVQKDRDGPRAVIFLDPQIVPVDGVHRYSKGNYPNFNLARWGHTSQKAKSHFRNGNGDFMYKTRDVLEGMGVEKVRKAYNKLKL